VLVRDIVNNPSKLNSLGLNERKKNRILKNAIEMLRKT
jgi:hypothetical protein